MRLAGMMLLLCGALALSGCGSSSSSKPDSAGGSASAPGAGKDGSAAAASSLAGKWELDIVADGKPHLVLQVAPDNSAKLLSETGFNNQQYAGITFVETKTGINVVVDEIQKCGNRTVTYKTVKAGDAYTGSVSGPNANCQAGTFQSPAGSVELLRQAS